MRPRPGRQDWPRWAVFRRSPIGAEGPEDAGKGLHFPIRAETSMTSRTLGFAAIGTALATSVVLLAPAAAHADGAPVPVASGLNSPRQLTFSPGGQLYVAEAGVGGDGACAEHPEFGESCVGPSGSIARVNGNGSVSRVVT